MACSFLHAEVVEGQYFTFEYGDSRYFERIQYDIYDDFETLFWGCVNTKEEWNMVVAFFIPKGEIMPPFIDTGSDYKAMELKEGKVTLYYSCYKDDNGRCSDEFLYRLRF